MPELHKIDLLETSHDRYATRKTAIVAVVFALFVGVFATLGAWASYRAASRGTSVFSEMGQLPGIVDLRRLALGQEAVTEGQSIGDRLNVLLLGVGGEGHDGPELTDTIILASIDTKDKRLAMLSIPRDLAYPMGNSQFRKINGLNAINEKLEPGAGARRTADQIGDLLNVKIDHVVRIDFNGFSEFIDALGGVDVDVERGFTDNSYPAEDDKYQTVTFQKGLQHMDGDTALKYARSRHGNNGEGSDFARSRRQQLLIQAVREKMVSLGTLANPKKISDLYSTLSNHIQTDVSTWGMVSLMPLATQIDREHMTIRTLTDAQDGELSPATVNGTYMLFPRKPDWSEIRTIAADPFVSKEDELNKLKPQTAINVEIKNGTNYEGYAFQVTQKLKSLGYRIPAFGNAAHRGYERTVIYDLTDGKTPEELVRLKKMLDADVAASPAKPVSGSSERIVYTQDLAEERVKSTSTQFLVILGESSLGMIHPYYATPSE